MELNERCYYRNELHKIVQVYGHGAGYRIVPAEWFGSEQRTSEVVTADDMETLEQYWIRRGKPEVAAALTGSLPEEFAEVDAEAEAARAAEVERRFPQEAAL